LGAGGVGDGDVGLEAVGAIGDCVEAEGVCDCIAYGGSNSVGLGGWESLRSNRIEVLLSKALKQAGRVC
jgi:hypothetical protein